ncbi:hypothetical protein FOA52_009961 [Chlamydomonas sp. UWO 241]|nr:hypothetical protein FOA52_009961 [Chlamydomonas sp. UWO 241]
MQWMPEIEKLQSGLERAARVRVKAWSAKLNEPTNNSIWKRNRNMHARLLLEMLRSQELLSPPFSAIPPDGPLPTLQLHLTTRFLKTSPSSPPPQQQRSEPHQTQPTHRGPSARPAAAAAALAPARGGHPAPAHARSSAAAPQSQAAAPLPQQLAPQPLPQSPHLQSPHFQRHPSVLAPPPESVLPVIANHVLRQQIAVVEGRTDLVEWRMSRAEARLSELGEEEAELHHMRTSPGASSSPHAAKMALDAAIAALEGGGDSHSGTSGAAHWAEDGGGRWAPLGRRAGEAAQAQRGGTAGPAGGGGGGGASRPLDDLLSPPPGMRDSGESQCSSPSYNQGTPQPQPYPSYPHPGDTPQPRPSCPQPEETQQSSPSFHHDASTLDSRGADTSSSAGAHSGGGDGAQVSSRRRAHAAAGADAPTPGLPPFLAAGAASAAGAAAAASAAAELSAFESRLSDAGRRIEVLWNSSSSDDAPPRDHHRPSTSPAAAATATAALDELEGELFELATALHRACALMTAHSSSQLARAANPERAASPEQRRAPPPPGVADAEAAAGEVVAAATGLVAHLRQLLLQPLSAVQQHQQHHQQTTRGASPPLPYSASAPRSAGASMATGSAPGTPGSPVRLLDLGSLTLGGLGRWGGSSTDAGLPDRAPSQEQQQEQQQRQQHVASSPRGVSPRTTSVGGGTGALASYLSTAGCLPGMHSPLMSIGRAAVLPGADVTGRPSVRLLPAALRERVLSPGDGGGGGVRHLTLLNVSNATALDTLSTASLAGLTSLTLREFEAHAAHHFYLRVAALADKANDKRDLLIVAGLSTSGSQRRAWDSSQLRCPVVRREFNLQLSDRFGLLEAVPPEGADAQAENDAMAAAIREVATNHLAPLGSRRRRGWQFTLSQRTLRLMDARQRAHTAWLRSKSAAAKRERNRANRAADAAVQRDRERWIGQQVAEAQDMLRKKNLRQFARACDRLAGRSRSHQIPPAMRDVSGALHSGPDGVLKAMTESFDKLYGGETKLSDETLNQLENDVAAFELTRATEVDEAHGRPPDLAETEAC